MTLDRFTAVNPIEIWQPRWKDRKVLIAKFKVGTHKLIKFTKAPTLTGDYYMSGEKVRTYPLDTNGKIPCYAVPLEELEPLEGDNMAGTLEGGKKTAQTNKEIHGEDFYKRIGVIGAEKYREKQRAGTAKPRGFAYNRELARTAGKKAGSLSKRGHKFTGQRDGYNYYIALDTGNVVKYKHEDRTKG